MSQRKLQQEIDRVFKKVKEGLEEFDFVYEKLQSCDIQSQKEKLENDLKKEIKKLQRSREQIKNWMSGNEVKDKKQLIEHRKLIEHEMERFKEVEKIMKTKAFSNEALASSDIKVDPRQKEKLECADFIQSNIEELERQIESLEAQADQLTGTLKKKKSDASKQQQIDELNELSERHKWHTDKLETILRLLENDSLEVDQINEIKEDIEYYVESNQDDHFIEDDTFYDSLGLDEIVEHFRVIQNENNDEIEEKPEEKPVPVAKELKEAKPIPGTGIQPRKVSSSQSIPAVTQPSGQSQATPEVIPTPTSNKKGITPPPGFALQPSQQQHSQLSAAQSLASQLSQSQTSSPALKTANLASTVQSPTPAVASLLSGNLKPATPAGTPKMKYASVVSSSIVPPSTQQHAPAESIAGTTATTLPTNSTTLNNTRSSTPVLPPGLNSLQSSSNLARSVENVASRENTPSPATSHFPFMDSSIYSNLPDGFQDCIASLEAAKERLGYSGSKESRSSEPQLPPLDSIFAQLESSLLNCPDSYDADKPRNYKPTNQFVTQACFPQEPAVEIVGSSKLLGKVEIDTLAYCFYYHNQKYKSDFTNLNNLKESESNNDGYLQYITAKELHKRGWRYQNSLQTWFHEDNEAISPGAPRLASLEESNKTNWKHFDFKDTWMVRRKNDYIFDESTEEKSFF